MYTFFMILHVIVCLCLILIVLMQTGKSGGLGGILGGSGSDQLFSTPSGSALFRKITIILATVFLVNCILLTVIGYREKATTVTGRIPAMEQQQAPVAPAAQPEKTK